MNQVIELKKEYILTDGEEVFAIRLLTKAELAELNQKAAIASDGEVWWELKPQEKPDKPTPLAA